MKHSSLKDDLRGIWYIIIKDMKSYYFKPPPISWGIIFPIAWIFAFYLRNPQNFSDLLPGLIAMTMLFSTSAAEATVINFEIRYGTFERLLLAPISMRAILLGKILGGTLFGLMMTTVITLGTILLFGLKFHILYIFLIVIPSLIVLATLSALLCLSVKDPMDANILMNLPRFIMVFLSGVVYPVSKMPHVIQYIAAVLPLTYTNFGLHEAFSYSYHNMWLYTGILCVFFVVLFLPALKLLERKFE